MTERLENQLRFIYEADKLKNIARQTLIADKSRPETDAEHSWHFALIAMVLYEYRGYDGVDIDRVIKMALVHDLVEIYAGDTFAYDAEGYESKQKRESEAADRLYALLPAGQAAEYRALWEEFECMETPDAMYANAVDRLQPFINNHLTDGYTWVRHGVLEEQILKRMALLKDALPALWEYVEYVIADSRKKGYIK